MKHKAKKSVPKIFADVPFVHLFEIVARISHKYVKFQTKVTNGYFN